MAVGASVVEITVFMTSVEGYPVVKRCQLWAFTGCRLQGALMGLMGLMGPMGPMCTPEDLLRPRRQRIQFLGQVRYLPPQLLQFPGDSGPDRETEFADVEAAIG